MRFLLSIIIVTLIITYAVIPFYKYIAKGLKKEKNRIEKSFNTEEK